MMPRIGEAHGKLILLGEHVAVYGSPAVGLELPCRLKVSFKPCEKSIISFPDMSKADATVLYELLTCAVEEGFTTVAVGGEWRITSNISRIGGFGSSSALCVALARVLTGDANSDYNPAVHRLANRLERKFHVHPSGLDTGLSSYSGLSAWTMKEDDVPEPCTVDTKPLHLLYGALPRAMSTADAVATMKLQSKSDGGKTLHSMEELGAITTSFVQWLRCGEGALPQDFLLQTATAIDRSQTLLNAMGFSTGTLNKLLDIARNEGALAGKLSGAGTGGAFFLLLPDEHIQTRLLNTLTDNLAGQDISLAIPLKRITAGNDKTRIQCSEAQ